MSCVTTLVPIKTIERRSKPIPPESDPQVDAELLEHYAFTYGRSYDSYVVTEPGRSCFWPYACPGVVAYVRSGKHLHVGGGLLAPAEFKADLLAEFAEFARCKRLSISFYNIAEDELPLFRECGFQATKWGEDALIDLAERTWSGKAFQWVRRQSNYCRRHSLEFSECIRQQLPLCDWNHMTAELIAISSAWFATKPQAAEMDFLDGRFDPQLLGRRRLFIARSADRIEGFLVCNPCLNGSLWALEVYRQRPDGVRGTVAFLIYQTLKLLQREGVRCASLCLVPGLRCSRGLPDDSRIIRWALASSRYFNLVFNSAGLDYFKSRFRPSYENRYVCACPKVTVRSFCSFVRLCGAVDLSPRKIFNRSWDQLLKRTGHATLIDGHGDYLQHAQLKTDG